MAVSFAAKACGSIASITSNKQTINFVHVFIFFSFVTQKKIYRGVIDYNCKGPVVKLHFSFSGVRYVCRSYVIKKESHLCRVVFLLESII